MVIQCTITTHIKTTPERYIQVIQQHKENSLQLPNYRQLAKYPSVGRVASFFFGVYSWLVKVLGQFSIIYFRGLGLRIGVRVGVRVWVRVRVRVRVSVVLCQGKFRVRVRIRVRVWFGLGL